MLTDTKLRNLKPQDKLYKVNDRDGLYVAVTPAGTISFRHNYSISGRLDTVGPLVRGPRDLDWILPLLEGLSPSDVSGRLYPASR